MKRVSIAYSAAADMVAYAPVGGRGGDFGRAQKDPRVLVLELHAEQEEIRTQRRVIQERLAMRSKQMSDCTQEGPMDGMKLVYGWLTGAAVVLIFGLLFSAGTFGCGAFGRYGFSVLLMGIGVVLALRAWGEYSHVSKDRKNHSKRIEEYTKECEQLNEQLSKLNLRDAELEQSIQSALRFM